jgi:hypothetical protein
MANMLLLPPLPQPLSVVLDDEMMAVMESLMTNNLY